MAFTIYPRIGYGDSSEVYYNIPYGVGKGTITGWLVRPGRDQRVTKIPKLDGKIVHGITEDTVTITVSGIIYGVSPKDVLDEWQNFLSALQGNSHKEFRLYQVFDVGSGDYRYYKHCHLLGNPRVDHSQIRYNELLWSFICIAEDPVEYTIPYDPAGEDSRYQKT